MGKQKSSATSGTRKKHARKAAAHDEDDSGTTQSQNKSNVKGGGGGNAKGKGKKKEPRVKMYIPPVKPTALLRDPVDELGLAAVLDPEMLVLFRRLAKRDAVTKRRALEDLCATLANLGSSADEQGIASWASVLPVWNAHLPGLTLHPSRRVRLLASTIQTSLISTSILSEQLWDSLELQAGDSTWLRSYYGAWMCSAFDVDRTVSASAWGTWQTAMEHMRKGGDDEDEFFNRLKEFVMHAVMHPLQVYLEWYPWATQSHQIRGEGQVPAQSTSTPRKTGEDVDGKARAEGDEESPNDRNGRIRFSALGALKWLIDNPISTKGWNNEEKGETESTESHFDLLSDPEFWSILYPGSHPPYLSLHAQNEGETLFESFGRNQTAVRRAGWALVHTLAKNHLEKIQPCVPVMSASILRSIWIEPDAGVRLVARDGLLTFLTNVPNAWARSSYQHDDYLSDEDDDQGKVEKEKVESDSTVNASYAEFLQFLRLACGGTVVQFYPSIVVIVSTLPRTVLPLTGRALEELFDAFWAAVDGHALTVLERGSAPINAFVNALLETMVILVRNHDANHELATNISTAQIGRVWEYYLSSKLTLHSGDFGTAIGMTLVRLDGISHWEKGAFELKDGGGISVECSPVYWAVCRVIKDRVMQAYRDAPTERNVDIIGVWREMNLSLEGSGSAILHALLIEVMTLSVGRVFGMDGEFGKVHLEVMIFVLREMGDVVRDDENVKQKLDGLFEHELSRLSTRLPPDDFTKLASAYLHFLLAESEKRQTQWSTLLSLVGQADAASLSRNVTILQRLLDISSSGDLKDLHAGEELSAIMMESPSQLRNQVLLRGLIEQHDNFLSKNLLQAYSSQLTSLLEEASSNILRLPNYRISDEVFSAIDLLTVMQEQTPYVVESVLGSLSAPLFALRHVAPLMDSSMRISEDLIRLFEKVQESEELLESLLMEVRSWILGLDVYASSEMLILAVTSARIDDSAYMNVLPSQQQFDQLFLEEIQTETNPLLSAIDLLVPESDVDDARSPEDRIFDKQHLSYYARCTWALTILASTDRKLAKENMWILKHALLLQQMAEDQLFAPSSSCGCFGPAVDAGLLKKIGETVQKTNAYLFSSISSFDLSHGDIIKAITSPALRSQKQGMGRFIIDMCAESIGNDSSRIARILRSILAHVLRGASAANVDLWLSLSRTLRRAAPYTSLAIISAAVASGIETTLLTRLRNEVASDLTGLSASRANTEGTRSLQTLLLLAPPPDSDSVFLPPQRAINLIQTVERWIGSDEDLEANIESRTIALYCHLAPILQSLSGRHWDFAFDLIENTLENSSLDDLESLVPLVRSLDLILIIQNLVLTNKQLNLAWSARRVAIQRLVRDLISSPKSVSLVDLLPSMCRGRALSILQGSPNGIMEAESLAKIVPLLKIPILETQRDVYGLVSTASKMYTEKVVIEVGLNASEEVDARLPVELMELLAVNGLWEDGHDSLESMRAPAQFAFLLGWMAVFDAFNDTSLRVRSSYVEQLRNSGVIQKNLIPAICNLLDIGKPGMKPYKLDLWELDTFLVPLYEPSSIRVLAAHIYYRALRAIPSLIRTWWTDCKDRQLSNAFAAYTAAYFSPILITAELSNVRDPRDGGGRDKLEDEAVTIKIAQPTSEVSLAYTVDDQQLEISVRMPMEYPLKLVEVRDVRRVGVAEDKWRGWLFAVQQIISTQNGHITDALALFKKNVTLHFQGQVECAICYSIISVTDLQLPTKPCKTCKNRFHASCLYKWFKSSSSSSCPLCRSDIF